MKSGPAQPAMSLERPPPANDSCLRAGRQVPEALTEVEGHRGALGLRGEGVQRCCRVVRAIHDVPACAVNVCLERGWA